MNNITVKDILKPDKIVKSQLGGRANWRVTRRLNRQVRLAVKAGPPQGLGRQPTVRAKTLQDPSRRPAAKTNPSAG